LPDLPEQKPELPAIAMDQAEGRFAQQKESLKRKGTAAVLRSKNRINSYTIFFASFFYSLLIYCFLAEFMNASHLGGKRNRRRRFTNSFKIK